MGATLTPVAPLRAIPVPQRKLRAHVESLIVAEGLMSEVLTLERRRSGQSILPLGSWTPLMYAARQGAMDSTQALLDLGAAGAGNGCTAVGGPGERGFGEGALADAGRPGDYQRAALAARQQRLEPLVECG